MMFYTEIFKILRMNSDEILGILGILLDFFENLCLKRYSWYEAEIKTYIMVSVLILFSYKSAS